MKYNIKFLKTYIKSKYERWSYQYLRNKWVKASRKSQVNGLALMYHNVTDEEINTLPSCICKVSVFYQTLSDLIKRGYVFVSVKEALERMQTHSTQKFVIITFDDVPDNVYKNAFPILQKLKIPFTVFIATNLLDTEGYLSKDQLLEMDNTGLCTVGAHSVSHKRFRTNQNSFKEMKDSKSSLELILGHSVDYMAYPYGRPIDVSCKNIKEAEAAGYKCAFGTILSPISDKSINHLFYLPRYIIN